MDEALVVYDSDEDGLELLAEAGELAEGVGAGLTLLALMTKEEFEEVRETLDAVAREEQTSYSDGVVIEAAKNEAREDAREVLGDLDVEWEIVGAQIKEDSAAANRILSVADKRGADHVFLTGKQRSPTGKAVFGDRAQSVILNFDGPVTTLLG